MKNASQKDLEECRPSIDALYGVNFCLKQLYADKEHNIGEGVVKSLTFEELIGVLLLTRDMLEEQREVDVNEIEEDYLDDSQ